MGANRQPHLDPNEGPSPVMILVRHGRTTLNATGRLRGHLDPPLHETGIADVARLANRHAMLEQLDPSFADTPLDPGSWSLIGDAGHRTMAVISTNSR